MLAVLQAPKPGELSDAQVEPVFKHLLPVFDVVIAKILRMTHIPMFTDEDLESFMYLKAHQLIRQQKWDTSRNPYGFFTAAFTNLMRDIIRRQNRNYVREMRWDLLDYSVNRDFDETIYVSYEYLEEEEKRENVI